MTYAAPLTNADIFNAPVVADIEEDAASAVRTHVPPPDDGGGRATHTTDYADEIPSGHKPPRTVL